jgi:excinuclease ABC subunit C
VELARENAFQEVQRVTDREERTSATLTLLGKMLGIDAPARIESYDISNISGTDIVASMVVFQDGKPRKSEYKKFKIEGLTGPDDYASMHQVITRRFIRFKEGDKGFQDAPDLLLIDGGITHANTALDALRALDLDFPVFGMVKDDRHRTRALVTSDGREIAIDGNQAIFSFIGNIQEETHRFAITYHRHLRSKRLRYSELDGIPGIGPKRKQELLKTFKSLTAMADASLQELQRILPADAAMAVYEHFRKKGQR